MSLTLNFMYFFTLNPIHGDALKRLDIYFVPKQYSYDGREGVEITNCDLLDWQVPNQNMFFYPTLVRTGKKCDRDSHH